MKIIVSKGTPSQPAPKTVAELQIDIADKLNKLVNKLVNSSDNFFLWKNDELTARRCANTWLHNKLIVLLTLFTDSNKNSGTYTKFYSPVAFSGYDTVEKLLSLKDFVDSIPDLYDVKIEIG